jgi:hypothetical protein
LHIKFRNTRTAVVRHIKMTCVLWNHKQSISGHHHHQCNSRTLIRTNIMLVFFVGVPPYRIFKNLGAFFLLWCNISIMPRMLPPTTTNLMSFVSHCYMFRSCVPPSGVKICDFTNTSKNVCETS